MRILLHPGFHKTGTSSLQRGLLAQAHKLSAHLRFTNTSDIQKAARAARRHSLHPETRSLHRFAESFAESLAQIDVSDRHALMISSEDLSGHLPGGHGVEAYDAAPTLMEIATACLLDRFGTTSEITIWFTIRAPDAWQRSAYFQNLRAHRVTESFEDFRPRLARAAQLSDIVCEVQRRLGDHARVCMTSIESCGAHRLGPLGEALSLLGVPGDDLAPMPAQNVQPHGAIEELLALNRSDLDDAALAAAKRDVIRRYRKLGQTRRAPAPGT